MEEIRKAIPQDPIRLEGYFATENIAFAATCCLLNRRITLNRVIFHPLKVGAKVYYLTPEEEVKKFYWDFNTGKLKVDPRALQQKIHDLKILFADKLPQKDSFPTVDPRYKPKPSSNSPVIVAGGDATIKS